MHVSALSLDLNSFFQFILTFFLFALAFLHLVKNTAAKYFVASFDTASDSSPSSSPPPPPSCGGRSSPGTMSGDSLSSDACAVCGNSGNKRCSGCKAVRYCSLDCQSKHWKSGHNTKCNKIQLAGKGKLKQSATTSYEKNYYSERGVSTQVALVPHNRPYKILKQSKEILFPYNEFVELFNWDKPGFPPCGLLNCGNSCFANVVLQCLMHTRPLIAYILEKGHQRDCRRNGWCFLCEFQTHVERAIQNQHAFSPINILSRLPNIGGNLGYGRQEDAHEFMRFAIDTMQSVCLDEFGGEKEMHPSSQETTIIQHIFGGHLQSQVICTKCNKISSQFENMMDLTVEIQGDAESLEECLDQFTVSEWLHGDNMYKCEGCNDYVKASKRLTVRRAPNVLTVALKRFQSGRFGKLNKRITIPETLDLRPYISEQGSESGMDIYKLYAVVVHVDMLNASFFGHYVCYTKDFSGNWYRIDDCKVMRVELEEVLSQGAYMLLYSRVSARPSCLMTIEPPCKAEEQMDKEAPEAEAYHKQPIQPSNITPHSMGPSSETGFSQRTVSETVGKDTEVGDVIPRLNSSVSNDMEVKGNDMEVNTEEVASPIEEVADDVEVKGNDYSSVEEVASLVGEGTKVQDANPTSNPPVPEIIGNGCFSAKEATSVEHPYDLVSRVVSVSLPCLSESVDATSDIVSGEAATLVSTEGFMNNQKNVSENGETCSFHEIGESSKCSEEMAVKLDGGKAEQQIIEVAQAEACPKQPNLYEDQTSVVGPVSTSSSSEGDISMKIVSEDTGEDTDDEDSYLDSDSPVSTDIETESLTTNGVFENGDAFSSPELKESLDAAEESTKRFEETSGEMDGGNNSSVPELKPSIFPVFLEEHVTNNSMKPSEFASDSEVNLNGSGSVNHESLMGQFSDVEMVDADSEESVDLCNGASSEP